MPGPGRVPSWRLRRGRDRPGESAAKSGRKGVTSRGSTWCEAISVNTELCLCQH